MRSAQFAVQKAAKATEPDQITARQAAIAKFQQQLLVRVYVPLSCLSSQAQTHHTTNTNGSDKQDADVIIDERYAAGVLTLEQALAAYGLKETDAAYASIATKRWYRQDKTGSASGACV